jgi:hypothetical protein
MSVDDDWIKPLSSPQKPELSKSKTTDVMEKLAVGREPDQLVAQKRMGLTFWVGMAGVCLAC